MIRRSRVRVPLPLIAARLALLTLYAGANGVMAGRLLTEEHAVSATGLNRRRGLVAYGLPAANVYPASAAGLPLPARGHPVGAGLPLPAPTLNYEAADAAEGEGRWDSKESP